MAVWHQHTHARVQTHSLLCRASVVHTTSINTRTRMIDVWFTYIDITAAHTFYTQTHRRTDDLSHSSEHDRVAVVIYAQLCLHCRCTHDNHNMRVNCRRCAVPRAYSPNAWFILLIVARLHLTGCIIVSERFACRTRAS